MSSLQVQSRTTKSGAFTDNGIFSSTHPGSITCHFPSSKHLLPEPRSSVQHQTGSDIWSSTSALDCFALLEIGERWPRTCYVFCGIPTLRSDSPAMALRKRNAIGGEWYAGNAWTFMITFRASGCRRQWMWLTDKARGLVLDENPVAS